MAPFDMQKFPQLIRDELDKRVQDLTSTVTFSLDVLEDMVPELVPYYKSAGENLFSIPRGCTSISKFVCSCLFSGRVTNVFFQPNLDLVQVIHRVLFSQALASCYSNF